MIFWPKIGLRSDLLSQDFLREACPQAPPRYYMRCVDFGHTTLKLHAMALHTLQHAVLCLCINLFYIYTVNANGRVHYRSTKNTLELVLKL